MALDQVKTQVLILHSEQRALDDLSAGIDDRYTVHCANTGTEALNTLGETPIHVIISAQDLPGMSGVEALREAKKRSPETIGILLAGTDDEGLEALVGEKEVFQIVRGGITGDDLAELIDDATRQMRLLALAESANDTAANPDEPVAEHIVMETSENGSTIISDGTGSVPILDPQKISAAQAVGSNAVDILVLTKDEEFLATVKESSRGMHNVRYANTLGQAEQALAKFDVGVAVVDAAMVGSKVEKLTQHLSKRTKRLVSIVAGRRDDGEMLMDLINRGKVYRFLLKPVSPGRARLAVEASVKHHLEAPEAAFKPRGQAAPAAKPKPKPKPAPTAKSKPVAKPAEKPKPAVKKEPPQPTKPAAAPARKANPLPKPAAQAEPKLIQPARPAKDASKKLSDPFHVSVDDGLSTPFDDDESSFTATMTGIVEKVGKKFSAKATDAPSPNLEIPDLSMSPGLSVEDSGSDGGSPFTSPKVLGIGAVAAIAIAAAGFFFFGGADKSPTAVDEAETAAEVQNDEVVTDEPQAPTSEGRRSAKALLNEARLAHDAGQVFNPLGSNAIELYAAAVSANPGDERIPAEFAAVLDQALMMAETAMLERRLDDATAALDRVRLVEPNHARLPFLTAQLSQMQIRDYIDSARVAVREARFEDAADTLAAAGALNVADTTEIDAVAAELNAARSAQRVEDVLAQAARRLDEGALVTPANDNARYFYELALTNDPGNTAARQGLTVIAGKLVLQARTEIDRGRFTLAENLLDEARLLDPSSSEIEESTQALSDARSAAATNKQRQEESRRAAARAEAERLAALQRAEEDRRAAAVAAKAETAIAEEVEAPDEESAVADDAVEFASDEAPPVMALEMPQPLADEFVARAETQNAVAQPTRTLSQAPIGISSLTRTKYVAPKYPRAAERRNQSGWVEVVFIVTTEGTTRDIEIRDSNPGDLFVSAATRAVERWEFEPILENGGLVEKRVGVRMMFALE